MEATVSHLLMLQRYISSKQNIQIYIHCIILTDFEKRKGEKTGLKRAAKVFSVDGVIDTDNTLDIQKYLLKDT